MILIPTAKKDEFMPMMISAKTYETKKEAGLALLLSMKGFKGKESVEIGAYRGFTMHLSYDSFHNEHNITLKGNISHTVPLGRDVSGNLTRIDNLLEMMSKRLDMAKQKLEDLQKQQASSEIEKDKPFVQEQELKDKSEQLAQLDAELSLSGSDEEKTEEKADELGEEKSEIMSEKKPSMLETLKKNVENMKSKPISEPKKKKDREEVL